VRLALAFVVAVVLVVNGSFCATVANLIAAASPTAIRQRLLGSLLGRRESDSWLSSAIVSILTAINY
jgi:hypothetical protein